MKSFLNIDCWALIAASGSGSRLAGGVAKQLLPIDGKAMLLYSLEAFLAQPAIKAVMVVGNDQQAMTDLLQPLMAENQAAALAPQRVYLSSGAASRSQSVYQGLCAIEALDAHNPVVLVHDAARPCVHREDVQSCLQHLNNQPEQALALATRSTDSIKQATDSVVEKSLEREHIWLAQTPQCARLEMLKSAIEQQENTPTHLATDDAWFLEQAGYSVRLIQAQHANIKVTWQEDMLVAAAILAGRAEGEER